MFLVRQSYWLWHRNLPWAGPKDVARAGRYSGYRWLFRRYRYRLGRVLTPATFLTPTFYGWLNRTTGRSVIYVLRRSNYDLEALGIERIARRSITVCRRVGLENTAHRANTRDVLAGRRIRC